MPMNSIPAKLAIAILAKLASDPEVIGRLLEELGAMPNIPTPTMGGAVFWTDLSVLNGWRVQKNWMFGNCRILDPNDVRRAWGGESQMLKAFEALMEQESPDQYN